MKTCSKLGVVALAVALLAIVFSLPAVSEDAPTVVAVPAEAVGSPPPDCELSWRAVRLKCSKGAVGMASGSYGGSAFLVTCEEPTTRICASSTLFDYTIEGIGASGMIVQCSDSGNAMLVNASCGPFRLIIN